MPKIGLKLWSKNTNYIPIAQKLFEQKVFDYVELFTVPDSTEYIADWQSLKVPYSLHAPHTYAGVNLAEKSHRSKNMGVMKQVDQYFKALSPEFVIFHSGMDGSLQEAITQLGMIGENFPQMFEKAIIENKPLRGLKEEICQGASPSDMSQILNATGRGFCLDFGHAICYSVSANKDWKLVINEFLAMKPSMYHLCDGFYLPHDAHEHLGSGEYDLGYLAKLIEKNKPVSLETKKDSQESLDDFARDASKLREYAGI